MTLEIQKKRDLDPSQQIFWVYTEYCVSKKSCSFLNSQHTLKIVQHFLGTQCAYLIFVGRVPDPTTATASTPGQLNQVPNHRPAVSDRPIGKPGHFFRTFHWFGHDQSFRAVTQVTYNNNIIIKQSQMRSFLPKDTTYTPKKSVFRHQ